MITLPSEHNRYGFSASNNFNPTSVPLELQPPKSMSRRQSMSKGSKIYALRIASTPGIYHSWAVAKSLIDGCPGAKYKGFPTIKECMDFFWEQFPSCTFTINDNGDYIMNETDPVYEIIAKARQKKQRNSGISLVTDTSSFDPLDPQAKLLKSIIASNSNVSLELNAEQQQALNSVKEGENVFISGSVKNVLKVEKYRKRCTFGSYLSSNCIRKQKLSCHISLCHYRIE
jgi:viroplasmin and RNaseH domain-containing protein